MTEPLATVFRKPFDEQIAAFRLRLGDLIPTQGWKDVQGAAHDRGFMVAGAAKADLLADLAAAIDKAISQGTGLEAFRRDFRGIVESHGWHGWTGEGSKGGEAWRTRVIYQTNMRTSYAAGRFAQLTAGNFAFWVYKHGGSLEPRLHHLAWDGVALAPDHPFWATHYPPNGWGCSCYAGGARTEAGVRRLGGDPGKALPSGWQSPDKKTGTPTGIDKGWNYAPGASVAETISMLAAKLEALPAQPSIDLIQTWLRSEQFGRWFSKPEGNFPLVRIPETDAALIGSKPQVAMLSSETAAKQGREHPELLILDYAQAQRTVNEATHRIQDSPTSLLYVLEEPGANGYVLVVKATMTGLGLFVQSFRRISGDETQRARTVRRLLQKSK